MGPEGNREMGRAARSDAPPSSAEPGDPWQDFLAEHGQVVDRVLMRDVPALCHHEEMAEAADVVVERLHLLEDVVRCAGEGDASLDELVDRRFIYVDLLAVSELQGAHRDAAAIAR